MALFPGHVGGEKAISLLPRGVGKQKTSDSGCDMSWTVWLVKFKMTSFISIPDSFPDH